MAEAITTIVDPEQQGPHDTLTTNSDEVQVGLEQLKAEAIRKITSFYGDFLQPGQIERAQNTVVVDTNSKEADEYIKFITGLDDYDKTTFNAGGFYSKDTPGSGLEHDIVFINAQLIREGGLSPQSIIRHEMMHVFSANNKGDTGFATYRPDRRRIEGESTKSRDSRRFNEVATELLTTFMEIGGANWSNLAAEVEKKNGVYKNDQLTFIKMIQAIQRDNQEFVFSIRNLAEDYFDTSLETREKCLVLAMEIAGGPRSEQLKDQVNRALKHFDLEHTISKN